MTQSSNRPTIIAILVAAVVIAVGLAVGLAIGLRDNDTRTEIIYSDISRDVSVPRFKSSTKTFRYAAVAADSKIASEIGNDILARRRGNAVDAAVAALFATGVMNAHSCGIGGGAFFTIYMKEADTWASYNSRERAPGFATQDMYVNQTQNSQYGGLAIGVPGELKGLHEVHKAFGTLPWKELVMPTVKLCETGVPVTEKLHKSLGALDTQEMRERFSVYFDENGNKKPVGCLVRLPELARTLRTIANDPESFYNGALADDIVADIAEAGGNITLEDLRSYTLKIDPPINITVHGGLTIHSIPAPGSGPVLNYILGILSGYNMSPLSVADTESSVLTYHRIVEAMKHAFGRRTELGDEDFVDHARELSRNMSSLEFGAATRHLIDDKHTRPLSAYQANFASTTDAGTSHLSVVDGEGNAVAVTSTINLFFGSKVRGSRTGIIFNNEMDDFSTPGTVNYYGVPASPANFIAPGKRPMSSMCPAIVYDSVSKEVVLVTGASGGTRITTATALNIIDVLWLGMSVGQSVDRKRLHHQLVPNHIQREDGYPEDIIDGLKAKGHEIGPMTISSVVQAIHIHDDDITAVSDFRKGGQPAGF